MDARIKKYLIRFAIIFVVIFLFLSFSFSYFSVSNSCYIKIKSPGLASKKSNIKDAIKYLKIFDNDAYKNFCRYTDTIIETSCMGSDWHFNEKYRGYDAAGCYIKGSKTIYLNPLILESLSADKIAELLKKQSLLSKEFWENGS